MRSAKHYIDVGRRVSRRKLNMFGIGGSREHREKEWAAFEAEAVPLMPDVFRVANYLARDHETAEDLTQETFIEVLKWFYWAERGYDWYSGH